MFRIFNAPTLYVLLLLTLTRFVFSQPLPDRMPLTGTVLDYQEKPVAGSMVFLKRADTDSPVAYWGAMVESDKDGKFVFPNAEEGHYQIFVQKNGVMFSWPYGEFAAQLDVDWKSGNPPVRLIIPQSVYLIFRVLALDGSPLIDTPTYWQFRQPKNYSGYSHDHTGSDGYLSIRDVKLGPYLLYLRTSQGFALVRGDSTMEPTAARPAFQLELGGSLHLKVTDENGQPLGGAKLSLIPATNTKTRPLENLVPLTEEDIVILAEQQNASALVSRDGDGTIDLSNLPPGLYSMRLSLPGYSFENSIPASIVAGAVFNAEIQAKKSVSRRARTLDLQLYTRDHEPYVEDEVALRISPVTADGRYREDVPPVLEVPDDLPASPFDLGRRVLPDARGHVTLFPVKTGRYRIIATSKTSPNFFEAVPTDVVITAAGGTATVIVNNRE